MITLYDYFESGNAYKVRLLLTQLEIPFKAHPVDILKGETRTPTFLAKNPNHRVPVIELEDGRCLSESNAILNYFADGTEMLPSDSWDRANVLKWMFFEQYSHEPYIAVVRFWYFAGLVNQNRDALDDKMSRGYHALDVMEQHLHEHDFFAAGRYTIADIALYAYTHVANEGGFELDNYSAINSWLERVRNQPNHITIDAKAGLVA